MASVLSFAAVAWGDPASEGNAGASYATVGMVVKREPHATTRHVANEFVGNRLALALGLPAPPGGLIEDDRPPIDATSPPAHRYAFGCFRFGRFESLPPGVLSQIATAEPDTSAAITVFDAWIANGDRHSKNIAYVPRKIPVTIFDHGVILGGESRASLGANKLMTATGGLGPHLESAALLPKWIDAARRVPTEVIHSCTQQVLRAGLLTKKETNDMTQWILTRQQNLDHIVRDGLPDLPGWGLL